LSVLSRQKIHTVLTSKDVLERTGISRATLNNYIATGLLPRPEVLPPNPQDGAAPRIGYFPDGTVERVLEIQRRKRDGWSLARITAYFAGGGTGAAEPDPEHRSPAQALAPAPAAAATATRAPVAPAQRPGPSSVSLTDIAHPAYMLDAAGRLVWLNEAARTLPGSPLAGTGTAALPTTADLLGRLLAWPPETGEPALRLHLALARTRGVATSGLAAGLAPEQGAALERLERTAPEVQAEPLAQVDLPDALLQALQFHEGTVFIYAPARPRAAAHGADASPPAWPVPVLTPVAVLVTTLQDAHQLWLQLPAREYFELVNEIWTELDRIVVRHGGRHGRHPGEGMVCHFVPQQGPGYLWNALAAAEDGREAMHQVSSRWQARKGWDLELCMNTGVDAGQEWLGPLRRTEPPELTVVGGAADHAAQLSRLARGGAIWATRGLLGQLDQAQRERITFGVPRAGRQPRDGRLLSSFARLQDLAGPGSAATVPPGIADLPVTEIVDLAGAAGGPGT
jgi:class 3 adenylate cyclase